MIEEIFFQDEGQVKITAASVGISKLRWTFINENEIDNDRHLFLMSNNRFDHLPIVNRSGSVTEFFRTLEPNNYSKIEKSKINFDDIIPLDTNIREVIEKFATQNRTFFFLRYQKNISGLITLGNLNCKQVQIYIFSLICELERELGEFLNKNLTNNEIIEWVEVMSISSDQKKKYNNILKTYNRLLDLDLENQLTEHFFLSDFFSIIKDKNLFNNLDYSKKEWEEMKNINGLRNRIAHPSKSLLDKNKTIHDLKKQLNQIEDLLYRLTTIKHSTQAIIVQQN